MSRYSSIANTLACSSVFVSYMLRQRPSLRSFRLWCLCVATVSALCFVFGAQYLHRLQDQLYDPPFDTPPHVSELRAPAQPAGRISPPVKLVTWWTFLRQVTRHSNFMFFCGMNIIQVFHCHFNSNFFPLFLRYLLGHSLSPEAVSALLAISFVLPHINNVFLSALSNRWGVYSVVRLLFATKIASGVFMLVGGPGHVLWLALFIISNRIFTGTGPRCRMFAIFTSVVVHAEGACKLITLIVSDLVDEDFILQQRPQAVSALVGGTVNLFAKSGQSLAPIIGTWLMFRFVPNYNDVVASASVAQTQAHISSAGDASAATGSLAATTVHARSATQADDLRVSVAGVLLPMLVWVPIVCGTLQLLLWSQFTLRGQYLKELKHKLVDATERHTSDKASTGGDLEMAGSQASVNIL